MTDKRIYKGDDTDAFGRNYIKIKINNPDQKPISKIVFTVNSGIITKTFTDESNFTTENIELIVNFDSSETSKLIAKNVGNVLVYDMLGKQYTCRQSFVFTAINGVICRNA